MQGPVSESTLATILNHTVVGMITILSALVSLFSVRVRSRASLELELVAAISGDRPAAATPWSASALLHPLSPVRGRTRAVERKCEVSLLQPPRDGDLGFLGIGRRPLIWIYLSKEMRHLSQN